MSANKPKLKHRDVVSNFLFKSSNEGEPLVALFRRSTHPDLHSYQGKLAPISGSVDASDSDVLSAAVRELHEETHLLADKDIVLEFCGKPFSFADHELGRSWTVHPFGWILKADEGRIKIDWEHSGWEWVPPERVLSGQIIRDSVPHLDRSLKHVYFGPYGIFPSEKPWITRENAAGKTFLSGLHKLKNDHDNGARVLATNALACLCQIVKDIQSEMTDANSRADDDWWRDIRAAAWNLIYSARPSMNAAISSAILRALKTILPLVKPKQPTDLSQVIKYLDDAISARSESSLKISEALKSYATPLLSQSSPTINIITLSSSSTIRASILHLLTTVPNLHINLSILESRPLNEGASLASSLITSLQTQPSPNPSSRLHITLAPDTHISLLLPTTDDKAQAPILILLGADRIHAQGHISNKTGSFVLAHLSRHLCSNSSVKTVVVSECDKIAKPDDPSSFTTASSDGDADTRASMQRDTRTLSTEPGPARDLLNAYPTPVQQVLEPLLRGRGEGPLEPSSAAERPRQVSVAVRNDYFEWVPAGYVDVYVCEDGVLGAEEIMRRSEQAGRLEAEIFGGIYADEEDEEE